MSYIDNIEQSIVDRLFPFESAGFQVVKLPDLTANFSRPFQNGKITVCYHSSDYEDPQSTAQVSQYEKITIAISIECRRLRTKGSQIGIYDSIELVKSKLLGFQPLGHFRMYAKKTTLEKATLNENLWHYTSLYCFKHLSVEDFMPQTEPKVTEIIFNTEIQE